MTGRDLLSMGYGPELVSIIPPNAHLAAGSKVRPESKGKAPGLLYASGYWGGYAWQEGHAAPDDVRTWDANGANIGIRTALYPALDLDVKDPALAATLAAAIERTIPTGPMRIGAPPKRLYVFRAAGPLARARLHIEYGETQHLVELLAGGQQFVAAGTHPSGRPYTWARPLVPASELPVLSADDVEAVFRAIEEECELIGLACERHQRIETTHPQHVDQGALAGDPALVQAIMSALPNTTALFPTRDAYLRIGYALRAALPNDQQLARELFVEWALKWEGRGGVTNTRESAEGDFARMHPPYRIGVDYLLDAARQYGGFDSSAYEFPAEPAPLPTPASEDFVIESTYSDLWVADAFLRRYGGKLRCVRESGRWYAWDGHCWRGDISAAATLAQRLCADVANRVGRQGASAAERKAAQTQAKALASRRTVEAVLALARHDPRVLLDVEQFDADPDALGTPAGTIHLPTGELRTAKAEELISRSTTVSPAGDCPTWVRFVLETVGGDEEFLRYIQRLCGYCLTGRTEEHVLAFAWGPGGNGKSTFLGALEGVLGSYAHTATMEAFLAVRGERHPTDLAAMAGARLVSAQEIREGRSWDEQRLKALTGGDRITARFMHQDEFTYQPRFKLIIAGNARPRLATVDPAIRRRLHMLPFDRVPAVKDARLPEKLRAEYPGILAWMIEGARQWYRAGLNPPAAVIEATTAYLSEEDLFGQWLEAECVFDIKATMRATEGYASYTRWCEANGQRPASQTTFGRKLTDRGFGRTREGGERTRVYAGIGLRRFRGGEEFL